MRVAALCLAAFLCATPAVAQPAPPSVRPERVVSVYDGDTLTTRESGSVRLAGYDSPERGHRGRCARERRLALEARDALAALVTGGVTLRRAVDDRGRLQANIEKWRRPLRAGTAADGRDVAQAMLAARAKDGSRLAVPYWGRGPRMDWCEPGAAR